jgi:hypothetical protein
MKERIWEGGRGEGEERARYRRRQAGENEWASKALGEMD